MASNDKSGGSLGPVRVWTLAAGGMVGGGIYIALGVVIEAAGSWAWLSFLLAGIAAVLTAHSYARLSVHFQSGGGAFDFLEEIDRKDWAGSLSWMLIFGYTLTISVYTYAFGNYVAHAFGGGAIVIRVLVVAIAVAMVMLNLAGAGKLTAVEVVIVSLNLLVLVALVVVGLSDWEPAKLSEGIDPKPVATSLLGAAAIFVSYEGFQLLTYEYRDIDHPTKWFVPVLVSAAAVVVLIYIGVALGATMIGGAATMIEKKDVALSVAAEQAAGLPGLITMTLAAGFATSAAINSTLFSAAKLTGRIADDDELPGWFAHRNKNKVPDRAICLIGTIAAILAMAGSLSSLVEAASLIFIATFAVVNLIAARRIDDSHWVPWAGAILSSLLGLVLIYRLVQRQPWALSGIVVLIIAILFLRPMILKKFGTK